MLKIVMEERGIYYMMLAVFLIGTAVEMYQKAVLKRLLRAVENQDKLEHPFLKQLKWKYKNCHRLQRTIHNPQAFLENQLYQYSRKNRWITGISGNMNKCMLINVLLGGLGMALAYRYKMDVYVQSGYMLAGAMSAAALALVELQIGRGKIRHQLLRALEDYLENVLANQMEHAEADQTDTAAVTQKKKEKKTARVLPQQQTATAMEDGTEPTKNEQEQMEDQQKKQMQEKIITEVIKEFFP